MSNSTLDFVFLQCIIAAIAIGALLVRRQTAYLGITCLFAFNVSTASLAAFFFGRLFGLREQWITAEHERVFTYSGWMVLAMAAAMWVAWLPPRKKRNLDNEQSDQDENFPWLTAKFVYFAVGLGTVASIASPFVLHQVATVGTAVNLLASWLKVGLILAVVLFKKEHAVTPLLITVAIYIPVAMINALTSGFTPFAMDVLLSIGLIAACLDRVTILSFVKLFLWMLPCMYLMIGWMASRNMIRSGMLDQFSIPERAARFVDTFVYELGQAEVNPDEIQNLIFDRIDMSDILAQETSFQNDPSGEDNFAYGATLVDGAIDLVPRAIWEDKPTVAGFANFVGEYTGTSRDDNTSVGVPVQFELYANGGAPFVVVGIFILTYLCARLERFIATSRRPLHTLMPAVMFLMPFANGIEQIMLVLSTAVAGALTVFVIARAIEVFFPQFLAQLRFFAVARRPRRIPATLSAAA
jgi:hypothetical protein